MMSRIQVRRASTSLKLTADIEFVYGVAIGIQAEVLCLLRRNNAFKNHSFQASWKVFKLCNTCRIRACYPQPRQCQNCCSAIEGLRSKIDSLLSVALRSKTRSSTLRISRPCAYGNLNHSCGKYVDELSAMLNPTAARARPSSMHRQG